MTGSVNGVRLGGLEWVWVGLVTWGWVTYSQYSVMRLVKAVVLGWGRWVCGNGVGEWGGGMGLVRVWVGGCCWRCAGRLRTPSTRWRGWWKVMGEVRWSGLKWVWVDGVGSVRLSYVLPVFGDGVGEVRVGREGWYISVLILAQLCVPRVSALGPRQLLWTTKQDDMFDPQVQEQRRSTALSRCMWNLWRNRGGIYE